MTKQKFKKVIKTACYQQALRYLQDEKKFLSKGKDLHYKELKAQCYFEIGNNFSTNDILEILAIRLKDIPLKANNPYLYTDRYCIAKGCIEEETNIHFYNCNLLVPKSRNLISSSISHQDIYSDDPLKQYRVKEIMMSRLQERKKYQ